MAWYTNAELNVLDQQFRVPRTRGLVLDYLRAHGEPAAAMPDADFHEYLFTQLVNAVPVALRPLLAEDRVKGDLAIINGIHRELTKELAAPPPAPKALAKQAAPKPPARRAAPRPLIRQAVLPEESDPPPGIPLQQEENNIETAMNFLHLTRDDALKALAPHDHLNRSVLAAPGFSHHLYHETEHFSYKTGAQKKATYLFVRRRDGIHLVGWAHHDKKEGGKLTYKVNYGYGEYAELKNKFLRFI